LPSWVILAGVGGVALAVLALAYSVLISPPTTQPGVVPSATRVVVLALALGGGVIAVLVYFYAFLRLPTVRTYQFYSWLAESDPNDGPVSEFRRQSDPEERAAWKRFQRGEITRIEYERRMARRRLVHGEISIEEYHEVLRELDSANGGPPASTGVLTEPQKGP
jgi:hypothetical protein